MDAVRGDAGGDAVVERGVFEMHLGKFATRFGILLAATMLSGTSAGALTLKEAIAVAVESNPEIG